MLPSAAIGMRGVPHLREDVSSSPPTAALPSLSILWGEKRRTLALVAPIDANPHLAFRDDVRDV